MKRLACITLGLMVGVACSWGGGAPQGAAGQQDGTPAGAQAPTAAAAPTATPPVTSTQAGTSTAAPPAAATPTATPAPASPPAPPQPRFREVIIPAGMTMTVALETAVSSDQSKVEDSVRGRLTKAIVIDDTTAVPEGTQIAGSVLEVRQSGRVQGRALVAFRFDRLRLGEELYTIRTARIAREAEATKSEDATKIGIGAAAGAAVGAIAGGKKGAAVGAAVGAGAGTGVVVATRGEEVRFVVGAVVTARIDEPIKIQVPMK